MTELTPTEKYAQALAIGDPHQIQSARIYTILAKIQPMDFNSRVDWLESIITRMPQLDVVPVHYFSDGVYAREVTMPAGSLVTSKVHKTPHLVIVSRGSMVVQSEEYGLQTISAPTMFMSYPGSRRVGFTYEDTTWTTVHPTKKTTVAGVEDEIFEPYVVKLFDPTPDDELTMDLLTRVLLMEHPEGQDLLWLE
jgi:hypothetical protein